MFKAIISKLNTKRVKIALLSFSALAIVSASLLFLFRDKSELAVASWFDDNYAYRQTLTISNNGTTTLTDFQVNFTLDTLSLASSSKLKTDCSDLRFTTIDGQPINYWIEENNPGCNKATTSVWIKVPTVHQSASTTVYMYYGNPSAPSAGSGDKTFEFFDDFNDGSVNPNKWTQHIMGSGGTITETGGEAVLAPTNATISSANLQSNQTFTNNIEFEIRRKQATNNKYMHFSLGAGSIIDSEGNQVKWWHTALTSGYLWLFRMSGVGDIGIYKMPASGFNIAINTGTTTLDTSIYKMHKMTYDLSGGIAWSINEVQQYSGLDNNFLTDNKKILISQGEYSDGGGDIQYIDYIFVHKYSTTTPTISTSTEETGPGPVAYWKFDEGQGTVAQDATVNNNDGTLVNATWKPESECISGKCLNFNGGPANWVQVAHSAQLEPADITIEMWIKPITWNHNAAATALVVKRTDIANGYFLSWISSSNTIVFDWGGNSNRWDTEYLPDLNKWTHLTFTRDTNGRKLYVNGILKNSTGNAGASVATGAVLRIGDDSGYPFKGNIDEPKIYPYARTADQIKQDYNAGLAGLSPPKGASAAIGGQSPKWMTDGLVGHWSMDEASGTLVADLSGNGNNGTLTNAQETGNADGSSSSSTIADLDATFYNADDSFNGMILYIAGGSGCAVATGTERTITDYASTTKTFTVAPLSSEADNCNYEVRHQTAGKFGNNVKFDGNNDYLNVGNGSSLNISNAITISTWIKVDSYTKNWQAIVAKYDTSYRLHRNSTGNSVSFGTTGLLPVDLYGNISVNDGSWHHIVAVYTGNIDQKKLLFIDGKLNASASTTGSLATNSSDVWIGDNNGSRGFHGNIDDVRIYNRALSPSEVSALYEWGPGPVAFWDFNSSLNDKSGNGYNLNPFQSVTPRYKQGKYGGAIDLNDEFYVASGLEYVSSNTFRDSSKNWIANQWAGYQIAKDYGGQNYCNATIQSNTATDIVITGTCSSWTGSHGYRIKKLLYAYKQISYSKNSVSAGAWWKYTTGVEPTSLNATILRMSGDDFGLDVRFDINRIGAYVGYGNNVFCNSISNIQDGNWHYTEFSYDGTTINIFHDGIKCGSGGVTYLMANNQNINIGTRNDAWAQWWNGLIDDVRIYNYARTQKQILEDMAGGSAGKTNATRPGSMAAYYPLDEAYGTSIFDASPNKQNLALSTSSAWTLNGKFRSALDLEKDSSMYAYKVDSPALSLTGDLTISAWIKPESTTAGTLFDIMGKWDGTSESYLLALYGDELRMYIDASANYKTTNTANLANNTWYYVAGVYSSTTPEVRLYVNGQEQAGTVSGTIPAGIGDDAGRFQVGAEDSSTSATNFFDGIIDEVKVYAGALSPAQIAQDFNQGKSLVMGAVSTESDGKTPSNSMSRYYCVPGDTSQCDPPVGEWRFDEGSGTTVKDYSGNNNHGTWSGTGAHYTDIGKINLAGKFNGVDDYVSVAHKSTFDVYPITVESWIKFGTQLGSSYPAFVNKYLSTSWNGYMVYVRSTDGAICSFYGKDGSNYVGAGGCGMPVTGYDDNKWHHVVYTVDSTGGKLYVDGILKNSLAWVGTAQVCTTAADIKLGLYASNGYFTGNVDQIQIFNYARTPAQIAWDFNRGKPVGWWKLDDGQGSIAKDASGNGNNGTLTNMSPATDWVTGKFGKALDFDGSDDHILINNSGALNIASTSFSWSAWIKRSELGTDQTVIGQGIASCNNGLHVGFLSSNIFTFDFWCDNLNTTNPFTDTSNWHHWAGTYDASNNDKRIYLDGKLEAQRTELNDYWGSGGIGIGGGYPGPWATNYFGGQIDDVRIYNYALTDAQVKEVMNFRAIRYGP